MCIKCEHRHVIGRVDEMFPITNHQYFISSFNTTLIGITILFCSVVAAGPGAPLSNAIDRFNPPTWDSLSVDPNDADAVLADRFRVDWIRVELTANTYNDRAGGPFVIGLGRNLRRRIL